MKVLIADKLSPKAVHALEKIGCIVDFKPDLNAENLKDHIKDTQVLVVRSTRVTDETIKTADSLSLIVRAGAGVNTIALETASSEGVFVANCPGKNADAVAELALGLLIAADRQIVNASLDLRSGNWRKKVYQKAKGLKGRTLGILGYGTIGAKVARRAEALGMEILVWSRSMTPERAEEEGLVYAAAPESVARQADAVSIHLASTAETKGLINAGFLKEMKPGAILVNTSRGDIVVEEDLLKAIEEKDLRVALDVFGNEPGAGEAPFPGTELAAKITGTHHIGASTEQASEAIADETVRIIKAFKETGIPQNVVNVNMESKATCSLIVRHENRVGVLAGVLDVLREDGVNVEEMQNTIFSGAKSACCALHLDEKPSAEALEKIRGNEHIIIARLETKEAE